MHEVISLSCSQRSGHILTQLYNEQESHIPYSKNAKLAHSNEVFLWPVKAGARTNYYPRSINFEYSGGFGFLSRYEYHEPKTDLSKLEGLHLSASSRIEKNEFQLRLDAGSATESGLLDVGNTKYWTDYNKLIYRPSSLVELDNYQHPDGTHRHFPKLSFQDYHLGQEEFKLFYDVCDDTFRKNLEGLDNIQGINFFSEVDNAWGAFVNEMMVMLRDEFFNNGVSSKHNLWCYGLMSNQETLLTRIKSIVELSKSSTLLFPLAPAAQSSLLTDKFDRSSLWHQGAVHSLFVDSIWGLNCQVKNPVRMAEIEAAIVEGYSQRNIVNDISLKLVLSSKSEFGLVSDVNIMDMYLGANKADAGGSSDDRLNLGFEKVVGAKQIGKTSIVSKTQLEQETDSRVYVNDTMDHITKLDSFPSIIDKDYQVEFGQNSGLKDTLKQYRTYVQRVRHPNHLKIIGEKSELIEDISTLIEEYTVGYEDESDWDE